MLKTLKNLSENFKMFFLKQELGTVTVTVVTVTLAHENQYHPHFGQNHCYHQHHPSPPPTCAIVNLEIFIQLKFYLSCHPICNSCLELYIMLLFHLVLIRAGKSKSLIRWKRLKGGKRRKKAKKANLIYN